MSFNADKIEKTIETIGELNTSLESAQDRVRETLFESCELVGEKVVGEWSEAADKAVLQAQQLQTEANALLEQAEAVIKEAGNSDLAQNVVDSLSNVAAQFAFEANGKLAEASHLTEQARGYAEQAKELASRMVEDGGWSSMLLMALIGFVLVFVVLVLLIFVMKGMGWVFTRQKKAAKVAVAGAAAEEEHDAITDQEIAAAIITALKLYKSNLHDQESEMLTINRITRAYSPWSSKIHGLTQLPERK